jgi:hypothetical protein
VELLAFREDVTLPVPVIQNEHLVGVCWKSFAELVARETRLPLNDEAKRSLFINISAPVGSLTFSGSLDKPKQNCRQEA